MPVIGPATAATMFGDVNAGFSAVQSQSSGTSAPANGAGAAPTTYQFWADTTANPTVHKVYDGASWVIFGKLDTSAHTWTPSYHGTDIGTASTATTGTSGHTLGFLDSINTISAVWTFSSAPVLNALPTGTAVATANTVSTLVSRDGSGNFSAGTVTAALAGNATTSTTATNATNSAITNDAATNAAMDVVWVTTNTGNLPLKVTSTKLTFNPSTGALSSTSFTGAGTGLTGTASSLTAGNVTTNANSTGDVTSVGNATTIAANAVTNAKMATMAAWTFKVNNTSGSATPTDVTIDGLTLKSSPTASDEVPIWDAAASAMKKASVSSIASAGSVSSIAGNTGAFTLSGGITNSTNAIKLSLTNATLQASPTNPTGTTSGSALMMGLGTTCTITPVYSGRVHLLFQGTIGNSGASGGSIVAARFGTGTAPANAAAQTGTAVGTPVSATSTAAAAVMPFSIGGVITGLTPGTAYWFDLSLLAGGGTASTTSIGCTAIEF
jgi:hypothetical protein